MADSRTSPLDRDPWDQQPEEGSKPFSAFRRYLEQGPEERSIRRVAEELEKSETLIGRWAAKWDWVERVSAWDRHMLDVMREATETEISEMAQRHARMAVAFQNKIVERLQTISPEDLTPAQLVQWFEAATKIERQAKGMPDISVTQIGDPTDAEQDAVNPENVISLSAWLRDQPDVDEEEENDEPAEEA